MTRLTAAARTELATAPWLTPFIDDNDNNLAGARERYAAAQLAARVELKRAGVALHTHERARTATGLETTALMGHVEVERTT